MGSDLWRRLLLWSVVIVAGSFLAGIVMRVPIPDVLHYLLFGSMLLLFAFLMKELLFGKKE
jgi:hypothetical protein